MFLPCEIDVQSTHAPPAPPKLPADRTISVLSLPEFDFDVENSRWATRAQVSCLKTLLEAAFELATATSGIELALFESFNVAYLDAYVRRRIMKPEETRTGYMKSRVVFKNHRRLLLITARTTERRVAYRLQWGQQLPQPRES